MSQLPLPALTAPSLKTNRNPMSSLTLLDIMVLIFVGGGALLGVMRGFVFEVLSLFAWVAVTIALKLFYTPAALLFSGWLGTRAGASLLAFVVVGGLVYLGGRMIAARIGARTRQSILGPIDRTLGLGFGAVKGLIGITLLFMFGNLFYDLAFGGLSARPDWVRNARSYPLLQASRRGLDSLVQHRIHPTGDGDTGDNSTDAPHRPI
ncbi:MAG: rane protein required for colicin production [Sphingomonas bacterium]|jgi:membrane protein required for colicin V production|nr:rane protein required for colicin production [Sphingomonas bacterium]